MSPRSVPGFMTERVSLDTLFGEAWDDPAFRFSVKVQAVATDLARRVADSGLARAAWTEKLGWKVNRLDDIPSGEADFSLRELHELTETLGMEFDLMLRFPAEVRERHEKIDTGTPAP